MSSPFPEFVTVAFGRPDVHNNIYPFPSDPKPTYTVEYQLLLFLSECLNFTFRVVAPRDRMPGYRLDDGNWTGIMGVLQRGQADFSFEPMEFSYEAPVDFTIPLKSRRITFLTQKPRPIPKNMIIFQPFSEDLWMVFAVFTLAFFLVFSVMTGRGRLCVRTFFSTLGNVLGQPFFVPLFTRSHVIIFTGWILAISFLIHSFKATLLSFLLAVPTKGITTIAELASAIADGSVKCRAFEGDVIINKLLESRDELHKIIAKTVHENSKGETPYSYINPYSSPRTAFIGLGEDLMLYGKDMLVSKDTFFQIMFSFPVRKKFLGMKALDKALQKMHETGVVQKVERDLFFKRSLILEMLHALFHRNATEKRITLEDFRGAFVILLAGLSLALLVFLGEILFFYVPRRFQQRNKFKIRKELN